MDERERCLLLARTPGLTAHHVRAAAAAAGALADEGGALDGILDFLRAAERLPARARAYLASPPRSLLDRDRRWLDSSGAVALPCTSPLYPPLLGDTAGAPPVLYVLGDAGALTARQVAMVGARRATPAGLSIAREMAASLSRAAIVVASGLALGIDAASHEGALEADGLTLAVCAHGLDRIYPRQNAKLAHRIRERGALISCFAPGTPPARLRFPWRNRILSGMAAATVVVEAARCSGSLHTADFALQQRRVLFAVPGSVRNPLAAGCHELLRRGARIAEGAGDVLSALGISKWDQGLASGRPVRSAAASGARPLDTDSKILLDALGFEPVSLNTLVERTGLPGSGIASMLLILELRGRVAPQPGGRWSRVS